MNACEQPFYPMSYFENANATPMDLDFEESQEKESPDLQERMLNVIGSTFKKVQKKSYITAFQESSKVGSLPEKMFIESKCFKKIILPVFSRRHIMIRPPFRHEFESLRFTGITNLKGLVKENSFFKDRSGKNRTILIIENMKKQILGAIYFFFKKVYDEGDLRYCFISSLNIDSEARRQGLGSLLLGCAILEGMENNCHSFSLTTTSSGAPLYAKFGFHLDWDLVSKNIWNGYSKDERIKEINIWLCPDLYLSTKSKNKRNKIKSIIRCL